jgi:hypothetical protein
LNSVIFEKLRKNSSSSQTAGNIAPSETSFGQTSMATYADGRLDGLLIAFKS